MSLLITTKAELLELVEELRGMATAAPTAKIRDELTRIANRYAARAADDQHDRPGDLSQPAGADTDGRQADAWHGGAVRHHVFAVGQ
jgi:hypothetical protein